MRADNKYQIWKEFKSQKIKSENNRLKLPESGLKL